MTRFTASRIPNLDVGDHTDPACAGLQLRVRDGAKGSRSWMFRFKWRSRPLRITIGTFPLMGLAEARAKAMALRKGIEDGIDPRRGQSRRRTLPAPLPLSSTVVEKNTVDFLVSQFMELYVKPERKDPGYAQAIFDRDVLPEWRGRDARTIEPAEVLTLLRKIVSRGSPVAANRTAALVEQMFKFGIQEGIVKMSPVVLLRRPGGKEKPRERALEGAELKALLTNLDDVMIRAPQTRVAVRIFLLTAVRRSELVGAQWSELTLDGDAPVWRIPAARTKTGKTFMMPLVPEAVVQFEKLKRLAGKSRYVFPAESGDGHMDPKLMTRSIARHLETFAEHGVEAFTLHDLRRTVRTGLAQLKVPVHIAERVLAHKQAGIIEVYDLHQYMDEKRDALTKWAAHLREIEAA